jgi:hypothetical protein
MYGAPNMNTHTLRTHSRDLTHLHLALSSSRVCYPPQDKKKFDDSGSLGRNELPNIVALTAIPKNNIYHKANYDLCHFLHATVVRLITLDTARKSRNTDP